MRTFRDLRLDLFQREAIEALRQGQSVIVAAPTGCGKTLIAEYAIERALEEGQRVVYTAPIKALSNQKFRDFGRLYGDRVGIMTGDVTINPDAQALIMTTEIFRNTIFESPERLEGIRFVIFDEVHYMDDPERGTVWEESIMFAPASIAFVCLSATISNLDQLAAWIRKVRPGRLKVVLEKQRPVPLQMLAFNGTDTVDPKTYRGRKYPSPRVTGRDRAPRSRDSKDGEASGDEGGGSKRGAHRKGSSDTGARTGRRGRRSGRHERSSSGERGSSRRASGRNGRAGGRGRNGGGGGRRGGNRRMPMSVKNRALVEELQAHQRFPCIFFIFSRKYVEKMALSCADLEHMVTPKERRRLKVVWQTLARQFQLKEDDPQVAGMRRLVERGVAYHHAGIMPTLKEVIERLFDTGLLKLLFATETFALGVNMPARSVAFETLKKFDGIKRDYMKTRDFLQMAGRAGRRGIDKKGFVYANIDNEQDAPNDVKRVMYGTVEEVTSQFKLSYATILRLYSRLGDGIYEACEKSFAYFRHKRKKGEHYLRMVSLVRRRIQLLQELGYLEGQVLTAKGQFCAHIYGYEVELTELFFGDLLPTLEPPMLAIVLVAISFEAKRDAFAVNLPNRIMRPLVQKTGELLHPFREAEIARRLPPIKRLDFTLSRVVHEWALGAGFERLAELTDIATGDIVRAIRMGIQLIRQLGRPLKTLDWPGEEIDKLRKLLHATRECLKRGEIDAERQLRRSIEAAEEEARAGGEETSESGRRAPMYAPSSEVPPPAQSVAAPDDSEE